MKSQKLKIKVMKGILSLLKTRILIEKTGETLQDRRPKPSSRRSQKILETLGVSVLDGCEFLPEHHQRFDHYLRV
jgi:hypothetical protein